MSEVLILLHMHHLFLMMAGLPSLVGIFRSGLLQSSFLLNIGLVLVEVEGLEGLLTLAVTSVHPVVDALLSGFIAILVDKLIYRQVTSSYSDNNVVLLNFHEHPLSSVFVNSLGFADEIHVLSGFGRG
jgi:hypothetical protein